MVHLASTCFEGQELDENDWLVLDYLTQDGVYGNGMTSAVSRLLWNRGETAAQSRRRFFLSRCFVPLAEMKRRYPRLHSAPWLLPVYWGLRIGRIVFLERYKVSDFQYTVRDWYEYVREIYSAAGVDTK